MTFRELIDLLAALQGPTGQTVEGAKVLKLTLVQIEKFLEGK